MPLRTTTIEHKSYKLPVDLHPYEKEDPTREKKITRLVYFDIKSGKIQQISPLKNLVKRIEFAFTGAKGSKYTDKIKDSMTDAAIQSALSNYPQGKFSTKSINVKKLRQQFNDLKMSTLTSTTRDLASQLIRMLSEKNPQSLVYPLISQEALQTQATTQVYKYAYSTGKEIIKDSTKSAQLLCEQNKEILSNIDTTQLLTTLYQKHSKGQLTVPVTLGFIIAINEKVMQSHLGNEIKNIAQTTLDQIKNACSPSDTLYSDFEESKISKNIQTLLSYQVSHHALKQIISTKKTMMPHEELKPDVDQKQLRENRENFINTLEKTLSITDGSRNKAQKHAEENIINFINEHKSFSPALQKEDTPYDFKTIAETTTFTTFAK